MAKYFFEIFLLTSHCFSTLLIKFKSYELMRRFICLIILAFAGAGIFRASGQSFIDYGPAPKFLELTLQGMAGGATASQNYHKIYKRIQNHNVNMGNSFALGARGVFGLRDYLGFGTAVNVMLNRYNIDMAIVGADNSSMSAVFVNNTTWTLNVPVFISFRFNVAHSVRWNVDGGFYYAYGFGGRQKQKIYRAEINEVDELVPEIEYISTPYYHSRRTLFNVFNRGDIGLHIGSSLNFGPHLMVGFQTQYGFKNSARANGTDKPSVHNINIHGVIGYRF